jgi:outer membrane protein TolC
MKSYLVIVIQLVLLLSGYAASPQSLSYGDAKAIMMNNSKKLQSLSKQLEVADYVQKQALSLRMPSLNLSGQAIHLNDDLSLNLNEKRDQFATLLGLPSGDALGDWNFVLQQQNFWSVDLGLKYPVFTGGKINAATRAADLKSRIKNQEVTKEQNALLTELTTRYFRFQLANDAVEVRRQALLATKEHWDNALKLEKNGMKASVESLQAEAAYSDANRELMAAEKDVLLAKTALEGTLGVDSLPDELSTSLFLAGSLQSLDYYEERASKYFPDINKLFLMQELAEQGVKAQKASYVPDVALVGKYHVLSDNLAITEPDWYVGVGLSFPLFDGFKRKNELRQYQATRESVELMKDQALQDIRILVRKQYQELEKQSELANSLKKDLAFAEELRRVREKAFVEGLGTSVDVVDATLYLSSIKLKRLKALYNYDITLAALLETCGESLQFDNYITQ